MKRVLFTGARGFIGRHCIGPLLRRGYEIHAVSRADIPADERVTWHRADLLDDAAVAALMDAVRPSHLLHMAWVTTPGEYLTSPENLHWAAAGAEMLAAFSRCGGWRAVLAGTCFEYDARHGYCHELRTPTAPATLYGACKNWLHVTVPESGRRSGLSMAWARIFFLYGPHERPNRLVASVIRSLLAGRSAPCSHGRQVRDFLHVADVADACAALLDSGVAGPVNIASGRPVALRDVILAIARQLDAEDLVQLGALPAREGEPPLIVGDPGRLRDEVGWSPAFDLDAGLADTIAWWRARTGIRAPHAAAYGEVAR